METRSWRALEKGLSLIRARVGGAAFPPHAHANPWSPIEGDNLDEEGEVAAAPPPLPSPRPRANQFLYGIAALARKQAAQGCVAQDCTPRLPAPAPAPPAPAPAPSLPPPSLIRTRPPTTWMTKKHRIACVRRLGKERLASLFREHRMKLDVLQTWRRRSLHARLPSFTSSS